MRLLVVVVLLGVAGLAAGQIRLYEQPRATGPEVVETVIDVLRETCVVTDDHLFLRRLAYVMTRDGTEPQTFYHNNTIGRDYYGGIWQVDENDFLRTQHAGPVLQPMLDHLRDSLNIDWTRVTWQDLLKPLYSGIAAALLANLHSGGHGIPASIDQQRVLWQATWGNPGNKDFRNLASLMELGCHGNDNIDMVLLVDSSSSMQESDFQKGLNFLANVVSKFNVAYGATRVAMATYSTSVHLEFPLTQYTRKDDATAAIRNARYTPGTTNTQAALDQAVQSILRDSNRDRVKVVIVVTDGASDDKTDTMHAADRLHAQGVTVLTVGVSKNIRDEFKAELYYIATPPACTHSFAVPDYDNIDAITQEIQKTACRAPLYANWTVTCELGKCSPYAFPLSPVGLTISGRVNCSLGMMFAATTNPYPNSAYYQYKGDLTPGNTVSIFHPLGREDSFLYVHVDPTEPVNASIGHHCFVTLIPTMGQLYHETVVHCEQNGHRIECPLEFLKQKFGDLLCKDSWRYPVNNPCTAENIHAGRIRFQDPFDNTKFFRCDLNGQVYIVQCPAGEVFDAACQVCYGADSQKPSECVGTGSQSSMCSRENILANRMFHEDPANELCFFHCDVWGYAWHQCCPLGQFWKQSKLTCETRNTALDVCSHIDDPTHQRFYAYPLDCTKYVECLDNRDPIVLPCPSREGWDDNEKTCVPYNRMPTPCP